MRSLGFHQRAASAVAALCLLALAQPPALAADGDLTTSELDNGLSVYVLEKHASPVAAVQVWYGTGAIKEHPGIRGLAHLFEHMMFRGSENFGPEEHTRLVKEMGGMCNAFTSDDATAYVQIVPASGVDLVLELEADRMGRLALDREMFETEREVVKEEYRMRYDNEPFGRTLLELRGQLFGDHPYSWGPIGVMSDLDALGVQDCQDYYHRHYAPDQAVLIVVGDVDPAAVLELADAHFGPIAPSGVTTPDPEPPTWDGPGGAHVVADLPISISGVAYFLPPVGHEDALALRILVDRLSDHLERTLTTERGICLFADAVTFEFGQMSVAAFIGGHFPNVTAGEVTQAVDEEIVAYLDSVLSERELASPRNRALLDERIDRYSAHSLALGLGNAIQVENDVDRYFQRAERIGALSPEDLRTVADAYLVPANRADILIEAANPPMLVRVAGWLSSLFHL